MAVAFKLFCLIIVYSYCLRRVLFPRKTPQVAIVGNSVKSAEEEGFWSLPSHPPSPPLPPTPALHRCGTQWEKGWLTGLLPLIEREIGDGEAEGIIRGTKKTILGLEVIHTHTRICICLHMYLFMYICIYLYISYIYISFIYFIFIHKQRGPCDLHIYTFSKRAMRLTQLKRPSVKNIYMPNVCYCFCLRFYFQVRMTYFQNYVLVYSGNYTNEFVYICVYMKILIHGGSFVLSTHTVFKYRWFLIYLKYKCTEEF